MEIGSVGYIGDHCFISLVFSEPSHFFLINNNIYIIYKRVSYRGRGGAKGDIPLPRFQAKFITTSQLQAFCGPRSNLREHKVKDISWESLPRDPPTPQEECASHDQFFPSLTKDPI